MQNGPFEEKLGDTVSLQGFFLALKYSRSPEVFRVLAKIIRLFNDQEKSGNDYLKVILMYIGAVIPRDGMDEFLAIIRKEHHEGVSYMETVADALREEGWIKGRVEDAKNMLDRGMSVELIHEITGLPVEEIEKLRKKP